MFRSGPCVHHSSQPLRQVKEIHRRRTGVATEGFCCWQQVGWRAGESVSRGPAGLLSTQCGHLSALGSSSQPHPGQARACPARCVTDSIIPSGLPWGSLMNGSRVYPLLVVTEIQNILKLPTIADHIMVRVHVTKYNATVESGFYDVFKML